MNKKIKSILLLVCKSPFLDDDRIYVPMGILYIDAAIKKYLPEVQVEISNDYDLSEEGLKKFESFDAIGVSIMTPQKDEAYKILTAIKSKWPNKIMIAGGPHVSHYLNDIKKDFWDYLVVGDGERDIIKILKGEADERVLNDVFLRDELDEIPKPDRIGRKDFLDSYHYELKPGVKSTVLIVQRGCPFLCTFCENAMTKVRWHETDLIKEELEDIKSLGYSAFYIPDDLFAINLQMIKPYLNIIKKTGLIFRCNGHSRYMTDEFAKSLVDAGCYEVSYGIESGSQKILDTIKKGTTNQKNYDFIKIMKKYRVVVKAYFMIGLPGENWKTLSETEEFIKRAINEYGLDDFQISIYYPYKGTQIRNSIDKGEDIDLIFLGEGIGAHTQGKGCSEAMVRTSSLSSEDLLKVRDRLIKTYKPSSHRTGWDDKFRDTHIISSVEYNS